MKRVLTHDIKDVLSHRKLQVKPGDIRGKTFPEFLTEHIKCDKGDYTFTGREPLLYIAKHLHKWHEVAIEKGTQVGITTPMMAYGLWLTAKGKDCGYCVPTQQASKGFFDRFERTRKANPILKKLIQGKRSDYKFIIDHNFFYLIGLWDKSDAISVPLDWVGEDEVDFMDAGARSWVDERLDASPFPQHFWFCRGDYPGQGIDLEYTNSDQGKWRVRCSCGHDFTLEDTFPECVKETTHGWVRCCPKCKAEVDIIKRGEWVADYPLKSKDRRGFRIPQLILPALDLQRIMRKWKACRTKLDMRNFSGRVLAIPKGGDLAGITDDHLRRCALKFDFVNEAPISYCGIDQGDYWHVVFLGPGENRMLRVLLALRIFGDDAERILTGYRPGADAPEDYGLLQKMNAVITVCDSKPERSPVRRMAKRIPNFYPHDYKGEEDKDVIKDFEGDLYNWITTGREETLELTEELYNENNPQIEIPEMIDGVDVCDSDFGRQLKECMLKQKTQGKTGEKIEYKHGSENHYGHAHNYAYIAYRKYGSNTGFGYGVLPVCGQPLGQSENR